MRYGGVLDRVTRARNKGSSIRKKWIVAGGGAIGGKITDAIMRSRNLGGCVPTYDGQETNTCWSKRNGRKGEKSREKVSNSGTYSTKTRRPGSAEST